MVRPRRLLAALLCGALLAALLAADVVAGRGVAWGERALRPVADADVPLLGVNTFLDRESDLAQIDRTLDAAAAAGFHFIRQIFPWEGIEGPGKGLYRVPADWSDSWAKYDHIVAAAEARGLELVVRLERPPIWARSDRHPRYTGPPDRVEDFGDFVEAVARRYRGRIRYYQIWNEPNLHEEWNGEPPDPEAFTRLLCEAYRRIKAADPQARVLFPSLAPTEWRGPENMNDLVFLERVYRAGGGACFDLLSAQGYGLGQPPTERWVIGLDPRLRFPLNRADFTRLELIRELMERYGDGDKGIWIGEYGWNVLPPDWQGRPMIWGTPVDEATRVRYVIAGLERIRDEWPWVGAVHLWFLRYGGEGPDPDDPTRFFALLDQDFTPTETYRAVQAFHRAGGDRIAGPGVYGADSWRWEEVDGRRRLTFRGTHLGIAWPEGAEPPRLWVDGREVPLPAPKPDPRGGLQAYPLGGWGWGTHTLEVEGEFLRLYVERRRPWGWAWTLGEGVLAAAFALLWVSAWGRGPLPPSPFPPGGTTRRLWWFLRRERAPRGGDPEAVRAERPDELT